MAWTIYRHYKGNHYLRLGVAAHSEDLSPQVVYRCLYDNPAARTWVRPQPMFEGAIEDGRQRFTPVGRLRLVQPEDLRTVLAFGYDAWKHDKTFDQYCADKDSDRNHLRGTRYLLEDAAGQPVAALNVLRFRESLIGLASVATSPEQRGKGHASLLLRAVMELQRFVQLDTRFLLFSEVRPSIYERHGFRVLPSEYQLFPKSRAMATGDTPLSENEAAFLKAYFLAAGLFLRRGG
jgi:GNAT superfamily N-acetyltransferase